MTVFLITMWGRSDRSLIQIDYYGAMSQVLEEIYLDYIAKFAYKLQKHKIQ